MIPLKDGTFFVWKKCYFFTFCFLWTRPFSVPQLKKEWMGKCTSQNNNSSPTNLKAISFVLQCPSFHQVFFESCVWNKVEPKESGLCIYDIVWIFGKKNELVSIRLGIDYLLHSQRPLFDHVSQFKDMFSSWLRSKDSSTRRTRLQWQWPSRLHPPFPSLTN